MLPEDERSNVYFSESITLDNAVERLANMFDELSTVNLNLQKGNLRLCNSRLWLDSLLGGLQSGIWERSNPLDKYEIEDDAICKKTSIVKDTPFEDGIQNVHSGKHNDLNHRRKAVLALKFIKVAKSIHRF